MTERGARSVAALTVGHLNAPTIAKHQAKLALVEKDVDRDTQLARRFRVFGTPTYVLLDPQANELGRVPADNDAARWERRLLTAARL